MTFSNSRRIYMLFFRLPLYERSLREKHAIYLASINLNRKRLKAIIHFLFFFSKKNTNQLTTINSFYYIPTIDCDDCQVINELKKITMRECQSSLMSLFCLSHACSSHEICSSVNYRKMKYSFLIYVLSELLYHFSYHRIYIFCYVKHSLKEEKKRIIFMPNIIYQKTE